MANTIIEISITGRTPLLCNRFTEEAARKATSGAKTAMAAGGRGTPREQAEPKLYLDNDGAIVIPTPNIFRCIIDAGKFFKAGKSKVTTIKSSLIPACLEVTANTKDGVTILIEHSEPWEVDERPVRIPATGGRILCYRPKFNDWALTFGLDLDEEVISNQLLYDVIECAGKRIGLGDFRPDRKGPFGKFKITNWEVKSAVKAA